MFQTRKRGSIATARYFPERCIQELSPGQTRKHCCGNICDSRCFLICFPVCPPVETLLRKQNLLPEKQNYFLANSETFDVSLCFSLMFPSVCPLWETWRNIGMQETMFPSLPRALGKKKLQKFDVCGHVSLFSGKRVPVSK
jgi:hypothetical protein